MRYTILSRCKLIYIAPLLLALTACATDSASRQPLDAGEAALRSAQTTTAGNTLQAAQMQSAKYEQVIADANQTLASGDATTAAEAYYLRGRALEDRPEYDPAAITRDLAAARKDYESGLRLTPDRALDARLRTQIGNVAYHQDDYAGALVQWTKAYEELDKPEWKVWVLYFMGSCQQRLGRFTDADGTFARLRQQYPGTEPARMSNDLAGIHAFYVQIGAFTQADDITRAAAAISAAGSVGMKTSKNGMTIVRTGDIPSYAQAVAVRNALWVHYPDAKVMP